MRIAVMGVGMLSFLNQYSYNVYSQNGEDGIITEALRRLTLGAGISGRCVEVGSNDGQWMSNTRLLIERGWQGLMIEADYNLYLKSRENWANNPRVRHQCSRVDGHNINAFVDERCDVLSIDTDGHDYEIFRRLQARPKIVIVEIDSSIEPPSEQVNADGGVGYWTMTTLALNRGYFLLVHTGNLIFVRDEYTNLFSEVWGAHPLKDWGLYFNPSWLKEDAT